MRYAIRHYIQGVHIATQMVSAPETFENAVRIYSERSSDYYEVTTGEKCGIRFLTCRMILPGNFSDDEVLKMKREGKIKMLCGGTPIK